MPKLRQFVRCGKRPAKTFGPAGACLAPGPQQEAVWGTVNLQAVGPTIQDERRGRDFHAAIVCAARGKVNWKAEMDYGTTGRRTTRPKSRTRTRTKICNW